MSWTQTLVVSWLQFVVVAAVFLAAACAAMRWVVQPAERIRLIQLTLTAAIAFPLLMALVPLPAWRLGVVPLVTLQETTSDEHAARERIGSLARGTELSALPNTPDLAPRSPNVPTNETSASAAVSMAPLASRSVADRPPAFNGWLYVAIAIALLHGTAAVFFLVEWIIGKRRLQRLIRTAANASPPVVQMWGAVTGGHGRHVRLLVSAEITTPLTFGWSRPVVLIPCDIERVGGQSLRYCLAHEWSHIERADILAWNGTWLCQFAFWLQPLFWTLRRELRICQDILADGAATRGGKDALEYSELLVGFARQGLDAPLAGALTFLDHPSQLMRRITMLLQRPIALRSQCTWTFSLAAGLAAALACGLCSAVRLDAARATEQQPTKETTPSSPPAGSKAEKPAEVAEAPPKPAAESVPAYEQPALLTYQCIVVDKETGEPIPNAKVTVKRCDSSSNHWPYKVIAKTTHVTDGEGKYTVKIPPEQSGIRTLYVQINAEHENHVNYFGGYSLSMTRKNEMVGERPFFERLKLQPADSITGKVLSPAGDPLPGVKLFGFTSPKARSVNSHSWLDGKTEADGSFRLNMMKGGIAFVWVLTNDYSIVQKFVSGESFDLGEIRVPEGIRLRGRAISAEGKPVAGIVVNAYYQGKENEPLQGYSVLSGIRRGAITDADGRFAFDPLPPGEYRVVPEDESLDPRNERDVHPLSGVFLAQKTTLKEDAAPAELEMQAVPHINFHAQFLDSQGKKRQESEFFVNGRMDGQFWSARAHPDKEGTVAMQLPHGLQDVQMSPITNDHSSLRHRKGVGKPIENHNYTIHLGTLNDDVDGFEIIRYKAPLVVVQAVNEAGQPIKNFEAVAHYAWMKSLTNYVATSTGSHVSLQQQKDGRQRTSQLLPDEEVTFRVTAKGYESSSETLKLGEGETKDLVVTLQKSAETTQE